MYSVICISLFYQFLSLFFSAYFLNHHQIMISAVPSQFQPMIVIVVTKQQVLLGQIMHGMNKAINRLIELDKEFH